MALGTLDAIVEAHARAVPVREKPEPKAKKSKSRKSKSEDAVVEEPAEE